jgi:hypothetical protein
MSGPYVIVWDLDGTLGEFSRLNDRSASAEPVTVRLRPGLEAALRQLSKAGFIHTALTLATPMYAELALRGTGLRSLFARVDGLGQRKKGDAAGIAEALGIEDQQRPHRMFFVGDHPWNDAPRDSRIVFHLEPLALARHADELVRLVLHLRDLGAGSLRQGFDRLRKRSWWRRLWSWRKERTGTPVYRRVTGLGRVVLVQRPQEAPVIGFPDGVSQPLEADERQFVPGPITAEVQAEFLRQS